MEFDNIQFNLKPIGVVRSCFSTKFGIPRQSGIVPQAGGVIEIFAPYDKNESVRCLDQFSHIWVVFYFHKNAERGWKPTVRPPRLGGKKRVGVFASRAPFRPNHIGLSALELDEIKREGGKLKIGVKGIDIIDGTPVLDIKPYIPYCDAIEGAKGGYADELPEDKLEVLFSEEACRECDIKEAEGYKGLREMSILLLKSDPRPAFYEPRHNRERFVLQLWDLDLEWRVDGDKIILMEIKKAEDRDSLRMKEKA